MVRVLYEEKERKETTCLYCKSKLDYTNEDVKHRADCQCYGTHCTHVIKNYIVCPVCNAMITTSIG